MLAALAGACSGGGANRDGAEPDASLGTGEFTCDQGKTFDHDVTCNWIADCADGSDEAPSVCSIPSGPSPDQPEAPPPPVHAYEYFTCADGREIESAWLCNGEQECEGGEDEARCFYCDARIRPSESLIIHYARTCDGVNDCGGAQDENSALCGTTNAEPPESLGTRCADGTEIYVADVCNGIENCTEGEDEARCFECSSHQKIRAAEHCDGFVDCRDGSDEAGCSALLTPLQECVRNVSASIYSAEVDEACISCTCQHATAATVECTNSCWDFLACHAEKCTADGSSRLCVSECGATGQVESVRIREDLDGACEAECPSIAAIAQFFRDHPL